ncbi:MAG: hypothetical protein AABX86_01755 [Nanoarchaeota archaeon]
MRDLDVSDEELLEQLEDLDDGDVVGLWFMKGYLEADPSSDH